ncbi:MAG: Glyoxalase/bleomycin resistance protein/dioxygenase [Ilumatobacteraceae bacterium]|nr:Glyoxalase/bleomycin resistance protein/dioxygenase [Ilumatobacteraceae bacterium]
MLTGALSTFAGMSTHVGAQTSHIGLCVTDLERSLRFYCDGLGFERVLSYVLDDTMLPALGCSLEVSSPVALTSQFIQLDGMKIELIEYRTPTPTGSPSTSRGTVGLTHLSFYVDDVDASAARLAELGGTIIESTRASLGIEIVFLADPDGVRVELMSPKPA